MKFRYFLFVLLSFLFCSNSVSALVCKYSISGYADDTIYWEVDSSEDKPGDNVKNYTGISDAGREPILNWNDAFKGYRAKDDIDNNKCPEYLIDSYGDAIGIGHRVYLANKDKISAFYNAQDIQKYYWVWGWYDAIVTIYKLADQNIDKEIYLTCGYTYENDEGYSFQLNYNASGQLINYVEVDAHKLSVGAYFSYTTYEEITSPSCNPNAYRCTVFTEQWAGFNRIYINAAGFKSEDETYNVDNGLCLKYDYNSNYSESDGEIVVEGICNLYDDYFKELQTYAKEYSSCKANSSDCETSANEFTKIEVELTTICRAFYSSAYYSDSCVQKCLELEKDVAELKKANNIEQIAYEGSSGCLLSKRVTDWILKIIKWIRYIVPILLIILSVLDFIKAIASDSDDEIKKVGGRFAKRLIAAVAIFLVPLFLEFLLNIFGLIGPGGFCI